VALADAKGRCRQNELFARNLVARSDLDAAETAYETATTQVNAAKAQVSQAEATLKIAETNLRYTRIISPVNGIVVSRNVDVGQTVAASDAYTFQHRAGPDEDADSSVAGRTSGRRYVGQPAEFTVDAYPDSPFRGVP
jgi:HlyD family secretion protein